MTVSNAFSRPDQLSAALRDRILAAADELGYVGPDPAARALARGTTGAVGVLLTDSLTYAFTDEVATGFLGAIADELAPTGLALTLLSSSATATSSRHATCRWTARWSTSATRLGRAGLAASAAGCRSSSSTRRRCRARQRQRRRPRRRPGGGRSTSSSSGHRRVAIVTSEKAGPHGVEVARRPGERSPRRRAQRMLGWLDALQPAGIEPRRDPRTAQERGRRPMTRPRCCWTRARAADGRALLLRRAWPAGSCARPRSSDVRRARGPLGRRLRRQPARAADAPRAHDRPPGRRGEGATLQRPH